MNKIRSWMSHHPFKVMLFTFLFTLIPAIMAVTNDDWFYHGLAAFMFFVIVWAVCVWRHSKNIVTALLIMATMAAPLKQAKAAGIAVGCVVVCAFGYCTYKLVKVCQKAFPPKSTNSNDGFMTSGEDEYAAAYEYSSIGSCYQPPLRPCAFPYEDLTQNPTTFTLNVMLRPEGIVTSMTADSTEGTTQTWEQFTADMAGHGLYLTGRAQWQPQFAINGVPCDGAEVPLSFDPLTGRVTHNTGGEMRRVSIERSPNLVDWSPLMVTDVSDGTGFKVIDTTREGQMFYRVQVTQP